jgi:hypothetical protein
VEGRSEALTARIHAEVVAKAFAWTDHDPLAGADAPCAGHLDDAKSAFDLKLPLASHDHSSHGRATPDSAVSGNDHRQARRVVAGLCESHPTPRSVL